MISAAVLELSGCDIDDSFSCSVGDQVYETEKILTGISKAHATSDTGFIIGSGTGHIEGYHTLILVPDVNHTVNLVIGRFHGVLGKKVLPVFVQLSKGLLHILVGLISVKHRISTLLINNTIRLPLVIFRILYVAKYKNIRLCFTGL